VSVSGLCRLTDDLTLYPHGSTNQPDKLFKGDTDFTDQHGLNPNAANPPFSNRCQSAQSVSTDLRNSPAQDLLENRGWTDDLTLYAPTGYIPYPWEL
jgi:hypothetical protein